MEVLQLLLEYAPEVVSIDQILERCWNNTFQGDNGVHKAITQLRRALDDPSNRPIYIETVRKRGYRIIAAVSAAAQDAVPDWLHTSPFRGLEPFEEQHGAIFFGRENAVKQLTAATLEQIGTGHAMLLLLGPSGSGKTSLVRAGLIPALMALRADSTLALDTVLQLDCADLGGGDPFQTLASVLLDMETESCRFFDGDSAESLGQRLAGNAVAALAHLHTCPGPLKLVLFVDRFEALFRLGSADACIPRHFVGVLDLLASSGHLLVILACRNDFYPYLAALPELMALKRRGGHADLGLPTGSDIARIVRQPAQAARLRFGIDPDSGERLDDALCDAAMAHPECLPLLEYCLQELYRQRSETGELSFSVFRQLGGIEGAIGARAEQVFARLTKVQAAALPRVLSQLVIVSENELAVTSQRVPWSALRGAADVALVRTLVDARLFISDLLGGVGAFGVAHEALLRRWPRLVGWIDTHRQALQTRSRLRLQATRWRDSGHRHDMLLPRGLQVEQARRLLHLTGFTLADEEVAFIQASWRRARRHELLLLAACSALACLTLAASMLGWRAHAAGKEAEAHRTEAEGLMAFMLGELVDRLRPLGRLDLLDRVSARSMAYLSRDVRAGSLTLTQRARALQVLAEVRIARADPDEAQRALMLARGKLQRQLQDAPHDPVLLKSAGENAFYLGQIHFDRKHLIDAQRHFDEYRALSDRLAAIDPGDSTGWIEQSYAHSSLGTLALQRGDIRRAAAAFARSVQLKARALAHNPGDLDLAADLADSLSWQAETEKRQGRLGAAATLYEKEYALAKRLHDALPGNAVWTNNLATALSHRAAMARVAGKDQLAATHLEQAEVLLRAIVRDDPTNRAWQRNLYVARLELLDLHKQRTDPSRSLALLAAARHDLAALAALEPAWVNVQLLLVKVQKTESYINFRFFSPAAASRDIILAVEKLEQLHARIPDDGSISLSLADAWLLAAAIRASVHDTAGAAQACGKVIQLLAPRVDGSADYHVLAPWARAHACLGRAGPAAAAVRMLERIDYRERSYLEDLSTHSQRKQTHERQ